MSGPTKPGIVATAIGAVKWQSCALGILAVSPMTVAAFASGDPRWFKSGLVAISSYISCERVNLMPLGVLLQAAAILAGYCVLLYSLPYTPLFVLCCGVFAASTILIMQWGSELRLAGSFTFIPALYLACESGEGMPAADVFETVRVFLPHMGAAVLSVLVIATCLAVREKSPEIPWGRYARQLRRGPSGDPPPNIHEMMLTVGIGVGLAAAAVQVGGLQNGQWAIWSAASVVTGNVGTAKAKMRIRANGAIFGVPLGIALSFVVPHDAYAYGLATLVTMLTLDIFKNYLVQFTSTCTMVALALMIAGGTPGIAAERTLNVVLGGLIGMGTYLAMHALWRMAGVIKPDSR